jgi:hypothetical protein
MNVHYNCHTRPGQMEDVYIVYIGKGHPITGHQGPRGGVEV